MNLDPRTRIVLVFNVGILALVLDHWASLLVLGFISVMSA